ncbi:MAG: hypothetical protein IJR99_00705 [Kiritimatiellae bacterium]|nr:hypothetical protein [Kiritimatiellia bacterium]
MLRRCADWDYCSPGIYQITLVLADRHSAALGRLVTGAADDGAEARVELSEIGTVVLDEWRRIGQFTPEISPLFLQIMPDHVHGILQVTRRMAKPLGSAIGGFKTGSSKAATGKPGLWGKGFQDTILFHEGQLNAMFHYLRDNPRRLAVKRKMPELFRVNRNLTVTLPRHAQNKPPSVPGAEGVAHTLSAPCPVPGAEGSLSVPCPVPGAEAPGFLAHFAAIGNHFLLDAPHLLQVQCSRSEFAYRRVPKPGGGRKIERATDGTPLIEKASPTFETKCRELLTAARHGAVLVSPCISDGEREMARLAFRSGAAVVVLRNKGFSPLYKPGGKLFDQTVNGKLLLLAPAAWPYTPGEKPMTRLDACVMNRLSQLIAGEGAVEINYKGMTPNDIDGLVRKAVAATSLPPYL